MNIISQIGNFGNPMRQLINNKQKTWRKTTGRILPLNTQYLWYDNKKA